MKRRDILKGLSLLPLSGGVMGGVLASESVFAEPRSPARDLFKELGVTRVINAGVTMTFLSGSLMMPETIEAINSTSHDFANMYELQDKVGAKDMQKCCIAKRRWLRQEPHVHCFLEQRQPLQAQTRKK